MISRRVARLMFGGDVWKTERAPVCEAADDAAGAEDLLAGSAGDSGGRLVVEHFNLIDYSRKCADM